MGTLFPKKTKYRKHQRGKRAGNATSGNQVSFGEYGLQSLERAWMTTRQIEAARKALTHHLKRGGKIWVRVFADKPVSARPAETRMGSGKGAPDHFVAVIKPGHMLFELGGITPDLARVAMRLAAYKLPVLTRFVEKI